MARTRAQACANQSALQNKSVCPPPVEKPPCQKSPRLQEEHSSPEQTQKPSHAPKKPASINPPQASPETACESQSETGTPNTGQKRRRSESEAQDSRAAKKSRASDCPPETQQPSKEKAKKPFDLVDSVAYWVKEGHWPKEYFERMALEKWYAKKASASAGQKRTISGSVTNATPSEQKAKYLKGAPYRSPRYDLHLKNSGILMRNPPSGITAESKSMIARLISSEQNFPQDSLFRDDLFETTCNKISGKSEARLFRDITPLLIPSPETLATFDKNALWLQGLIESCNEEWTSCQPLTTPCPQPDFSVGFREEAFTQEQLDKLHPFVGDLALGDMSLFMGTYFMYFPFLTCEVECGDVGLGAAERQNAHSASIAARTVFELYSIVNRQEELNGQILAFSASHDNSSIQIYGHYPALKGDTVKYCRCLVKLAVFSDPEGKNKWASYQFIKNVYDIWVPEHLKRICSAIDDLPSPSVVDREQPPSIEESLE